MTIPTRSFTRFVLISCTTGASSLTRVVQIHLRCAHTSQTLICIGSVTSRAISVSWVTRVVRVPPPVISRTINWATIIANQMGVASLATRTGSWVIISRTSRAPCSTVEKLQDRIRVDSQFGVISSHKSISFLHRFDIVNIDSMGVSLFYLTGSCIEKEPNLLSVKP